MPTHIYRMGHQIKNISIIELILSNYNDCEMEIAA